MTYTVKQLAKLSGLSIRTLHFYDEIELLKPAYYGEQGYRYYEDKELFLLQNILFYRELGFELQHIKEIITKSDFDIVAALRSHKKVLRLRLKKTKRLLHTITITIEHLKEGKAMDNHKIFSGFDKERQNTCEEELEKLYGEKMKGLMIQSKSTIKHWTQEDWIKSHKHFEAICLALTNLLESDAKVDSEEVQNVIFNHYVWLKSYWSPTKETYAIHGELIIHSSLKNVYDAYHPELAVFMKDAIQIFAKHRLS